MTLHNTISKWSTTALLATTLLAGLQWGAPVLGTTPLTATAASTPAAAVWVTMCELRGGDRQ